MCTVSSIKKGFYYEKLISYEEVFFSSTFALEPRDLTSRPLANAMCAREMHYPSTCLPRGMTLGLIPAPMLRPSALARGDPRTHYCRHLLLDLLLRPPSARYRHLLSTLAKALARAQAASG